MSSFAALMAISKAQTKVNEDAVKTQLREREAKQRKEREEAERRHREELERQAKLRKQQEEALARELQQQKKKEEQVAALERARELKAKQQVNKLLGKAREDAYYPTDRSPNGKPLAKKRRRSTSPGSNESDNGTGGQGLTRLEKRALKMDPDSRPSWAADLVRGGGSKQKSRSESPAHRPSTSRPKHRKSANGSSPSKATQNHITFESAVNQHDDANLSVRERIKANYFVPIKLAAERRDTRSQADYLEEKRQRDLGFVKSADDILDDFFPQVKKKNQAAGGVSGTGTPTGRASSTTSTSKPSGVSPRNTATLSLPSSSSRAPSAKGMTGAAFKKPVALPPRAVKRARSASFDSDDLDGLQYPPYKKPTKGSSVNPSLRKEIWKLVAGKDSTQFRDDVYSDEEDDDDMEVSMAEVQREEARALKAAKMEDQAEMEEEARREEAKRKKKLARQRELDTKKY